MISASGLVEDDAARTEIRRVLEEIAAHVERR